MNMKPMKTRLLTSLVVLGVLAFSAGASGQIMTVFLSSDTNSPYPSSTNIIIGADTVVEWGNVSCYVSVSFPDSPGSTNFTQTFNMNGSFPGQSSWGSDGDVRSVAGPVLLSVSLFGLPFYTNGYFTLKLTKQTGAFTPSTAVVIPSDAQGLADIPLESSTNFVDWVQALPGTYGTSSPARYFRVRAVRK